MQEKCSLTDTPQRSRAKFIRTGAPLDDVIGQTETHMVKRKIREELYFLLIEGLSGRQTACQQRRMAAAASDRLEQFPAINDRRRTVRLASHTACGRGLIQEAHEGHERHNI